VLQHRYIPILVFEVLFVAAIRFWVNH